MRTISSKEIWKQYHSKKSICLAAWPVPLLITFQAELGETLRKAPNDDPLKARPAEGQLLPSEHDDSDDHDHDDDDDSDGLEGFLWQYCSTNSRIHSARHNIHSVIVIANPI